jgi:hypothetical protein
MTNLLLHICCGVCAGALIEKWRSDGLEITGYFYNPNIHPYQEFQKRLRAVEVQAERENLEVYYEREYGLNEFLKQVLPIILKNGKDETDRKRCAICYETRLRQTAHFARVHNFDAFSSTLIISPQQNQELIRDIGGRIAQESGIQFKYELLTNLYSRSVELAKKRSLYRQQYCGCIFSEYERYKK